MMFCSIMSFLCRNCYIAIILRNAEFSYSFSSSGDRPLIVQFAAHDAQTLADAACVVAPFSDGVDLNCGCPQRCTDNRHENSLV